MDTPEVWVEIEDHPGYVVSNLGHIAKAGREDRPMRVSLTTTGHSKIGLLDRFGERKTRSAAILVAQAFVEPEHPHCDKVIVKNMDYGDLRAENLAWRPDGFAWEYANQFKRPIPIHYTNLSVADVVHEITYPNIMEAAGYQGLLFKDIWRSTYTGDETFPTRSIFVVVE